MYDYKFPAMIEELAEQARIGDRDAQNQILDVTHPRLFRIALSTLNDAALAEDAVQDAQMELVKKNYCTGGILVWPWLCGAVRKKALQIRRKRTNKDALNRAVPITSKNNSGKEVTLEPASSAGTADDQAIRNENIRQVRECIDRLPDENREALDLFHFDAKTVSEAADALCIPIPTLKSRRKRARELLIDCLTRSGVVDEVPSSA